MNQLKKLFAK
jgi:hypothetical protein